MKRTICRIGIVAVVGAAIMWMTSPSAFALGFSNPDQDARATGQGNAFVAQADDPSAVFYNPAGLTQIQGTEVTSGAYVYFPDNRLAGAGSGAEMNTMSFIPHFYAASDFGAKSPWRFGLGANVPFGNSAEYADNGPFRYNVTAASLTVLNIQPTVAYQINEQLSLGAGLNIYHGHTALKSHVLISPFLPDAHFHFDGDGDAFGATAGLMWKITPQFTMGAVYRSPFSINFDGSGDLTIVDVPHPANTTIQFPQSAAGGLAFRPMPKLKLELDAEWTGWQTLNTVVLHSTPSASFNGKTIPFDWHDSWLYKAGAEYQINDSWAVRGGYIFSQNTVPGNTFSPMVPDSNRHVLSAGLGFSNHRMSVDAAYQYSFQQGRNVSIPLNDGLGGTATGTWRSDAHAVIVTGALKF